MRSGKADSMNVRVVNDIGDEVATLWRKRQMWGEAFRVALPLSSTPMPIYERVIDRHNEFDWNNTQFV
jgi:6-phosphogluconolactonase/glucosamine-6-phosphate isomerase/deaminase